MDLPWTESHCHSACRRNWRNLLAALWLEISHWQANKEKKQKRLYSIAVSNSQEWRFTWSIWKFAYRKSKSTPRRPHSAGSQSVAWKSRGVAGRAAAAASDSPSLDAMIASAVRVQGKGINNLEKVTVSDNIDVHILSPKKEIHISANNDFVCVCVNSR